MGIVIQDPAIMEQAKRLAELRGISVEQAIGVALQKELECQPPQPPKKKATYEEIKAIIDHYNSLPVYDTRTPDEILGYNEYGTFD